VITSTWKSLDPEIHAFIAEFERRGAEPESDAGEQFADQFISADPHQTMVLTRDILVASLPRRRQMFAEVGVGSARCVDAVQLDLDDRYLLVRSEWDADRTGGQPLRLESTFLVRREDDGPRIVVYLNHRDIAAVLAREVMATTVNPEPVHSGRDQQPPNGTGAMSGQPDTERVTCHTTVYAPIERV
jgi:hypothetical protein